MKKFSVVLIPLVISSIFIFATCQAQVSKYVDDLHFGDVAKLDRSFRTDNLPGPLDEKSVSIKAVRNFKKSYPEVLDAKWKENNKFYFVTFSANDIKHKIVYTKNGNVDYSLKMYAENNLPLEIRNSVKSIYFDYHINTAQELKIKGNTIYVVQLENRTNVKTLRVTAAEMEEIEDLKKG